MLYGLVVMGIEAAELHIEDLPAHAQAALSADDPGNCLQRDSERIVGELIRHADRDTEEDSESLPRPPGASHLPEAPAPALSD